MKVIHKPLTRVCNISAVLDIGFKVTRPVVTKFPIESLWVEGTKIAQMVQVT